MYSDSLVEINLYMKHDEWQSQYINAILNYQKIGFRRVSDMVMLERGTSIMDLGDKKEG